MAKKDADTTTGEVTDMEPIDVGEVKLDFDPRTWQEVEEALADLGGIVEFEGSPYEVVSKDTLVDKPFLITNIRFNKSGDFGGFVSVCVLDEEQRMLVFNDGSTGVYEQLRQMTEKTHRFSGIMCRKGLRVSEYKYQEKDFDGEPMGPEKPAKTFYLA